MANLQDYQLFYALANGRAIDTATLIEEYEQIKPLEGDAFFEKYGLGNINGITLYPYERLKGYEIVLDVLESHNPTHFREIHKGTPYYFMAWLSIQMEDYEKGVFYIDTSISEDLRLLGSAWDINASEPTPGIKFTLLIDANIQVASDAAIKLETLVSQELMAFSSAAQVSLSKDLFIQKFIKDSGLFRNGTFRTIVTSLYSYILEFQSRRTQLKIRSSEEGSIEPFLTHLFKGCVILESLLKLKAPGDTAQTLDPAIRAHNATLGIDLDTFPRKTSFEQVINNMVNLKAQNADYKNVCFATAYGMRNTTGHQLAWPDVFRTAPETYEQAYESILGAIFWSIYKLWVE
ncbi:MAG: hypothetical protein HY044_02170 [Candidatus Woesebacteria bacterium]|nr:MAG: hypothetical protein HY044_02170 [Candidatus Woesebacteria bacterium]